MAICNLFRNLSKDTGNFLMFSQYSDDLTRCFVQHDNYDVLPSRFMALDINYGAFNILDGDLNSKIPEYFQNYFENGCAWIKSTDIKQFDAEDQTKQRNWECKNYSPDISTNLFWNAMFNSGLIKTRKVSEDFSGYNGQDFEYCPQVKYIGTIDIQSYKEHSGVGYSELYCYIPNKAQETLYQFEPTQFSDEVEKVTLSYDKNTIMGFGETSIEGALNMNVKPNTKYCISKPYDIVEDDDNFIIKPVNDILYDLHQPSRKSFEFNTIIVFYNVHVKQTDGTSYIAYKNVPLGIYFTGLIDDKGKMSNAVTKFNECTDAYNNGTSYGLRVCTRYMTTANATSINSVEVNGMDQYAGFSQAMNLMAESQIKMDKITSDFVNNTQDIKDHIQIFKNHKANVPYIKEIGGVPYWFVNGRNTGYTSYGRQGKDGKDGTQISTIIGEDGRKYWVIDGIETEICAQGIDGQNGIDGAQGPRGHSVFSASTSDIINQNGVVQGINPPTSETWMEGDYILYTGDNKTISKTFDLYRVDKLNQVTSNTNTKLWKLVRVCNLSVRKEQPTETPTNPTHTTTTAAPVITNDEVSRSSEQKSFHNIGSSFYYCGGNSPAATSDDVFVEVPYTINYEKKDNKINIEMNVDGYKDIVISRKQGLLKSPYYKDEYVLNSSKLLTYKASKQYIVDQSLFNGKKYTYQYDKTRSITLPKNTIKEQFFKNGVGYILFEDDLTYIPSLRFFTTGSDGKTVIDSITEITIPDTVTLLCNSAFNSCVKLSKVNINTDKSKLEIIDSNAFNWCSSLNEIHLPTSVSVIGTGAFSTHNKLSKTKVFINVADDMFNSIVENRIWDASDGVTYAVAIIKSADSEGPVTATVTATATETTTATASPEPEKPEPETTTATEEPTTTATEEPTTTATEKPNSDTI